MEAESYARQHGFAFEAVELDLIMSLDRCFQRVQVEGLEAQMQGARKENP